MAKAQKNSPAARVIAKCGGYRTVSDWLGLSVAQVYKFTYAREKGGTGGLIPADHQPTLLKIARENDIALTPDDFFDLDVMAGGASGVAA